MRISKKGLSLIKEFEGCELNAYRCPSNVLTIGWGHTEGVYEGQFITQAEADNLLTNDMIKYENYVNNCSNLTFTPNQNQFDALVSFTYNCGPGSLDTLTLNRDASTVADKLLLYVNGSNGVLEGLVRRRKAERELFLDCQVTNPSVTPNSSNIVEEVGNIDIIGICKAFIGADCGTLQMMLKAIGYDLKCDNEFGKITYDAVIDYQSKRGLVADGKVGAKTLKALGDDISKIVCGIKYTTPDATRLIQWLLNINVDGVFWTGTENEVKQYQSNNGLVADGIVGQKTWSKLLGI